MQNDIETKMKQHIQPLLSSLDRIDVRIDQIIDQIKQSAAFTELKPQKGWVYTDLRGIILTAAEKPFPVKRAGRWLRFTIDEEQDYDSEAAEFEN